MSEELVEIEDVRQEIAAAERDIASRTSKSETASVAKPGLTNRVFFDQVVKAVRAEVRVDLNDFEARPYHHLLKVYFGNERVHFEVAPDSQRDLVEVALHFEDGPLSTSAYLRFFDARIVELKHVLGPTVELERWTSTWGRLYHMIPRTPFDAACARRTSELLTRMIDTLQPLIVEAGVPRERVDQPYERRRWHRRAG